jgi:N-hydroxyarylamine O-acetyltransferase
VYIQTYLKRILFDKTISSNHETLRGLQTAHMLAIPFENLNISLHRPILLGEQELWDKIVLNRRGGFCYELNGLFAWLLKQIGFDVTYLSARVARKDGTFGPAFDHLTLLVKTPGMPTRWLADVGFGDSFIEPLNFETRQEQEQGLRVYQVVETSGTFTIRASDYEGNWTPQYQFDLTPHRFPSEYEAMCVYHQTSTDSSFTRGRMISKATPDGRITLDDKKLVITKNGQRQEIPHTENEFNQLLKEYFEIAL